MVTILVSAGNSGSIPMGAPPLRPWSAASATGLPPPLPGVAGFEAISAAPGSAPTGVATSSEAEPLAGFGGGGAESAASPSARITPIGVLTATLSVPSSTRMALSVPSSTASTSMVALSVSISASTSPDLIASPTFLTHLLSLPCSIVGDRAGINTLVAMFRP